MNAICEILACYLHKRSHVSTWEKHVRNTQTNSRSWGACAGVAKRSGPDQAFPSEGWPVRAQPRQGSSGRRRELRTAQRRDARHRRRIRLRQVHHLPADHGPHAADRGRNNIRRTDCRIARADDERLPPPGADGVSGQLFFAQSPADH